eukprot:scaffold168003_cov33-Tisochrysis_lutea.AAC.1
MHPFQNALPVEVQDHSHSPRDVGLPSAALAAGVPRDGATAWLQALRKRSTSIGQLGKGVHGLKCGPGGTRLPSPPAIRSLPPSHAGRAGGGLNSDLYTNTVDKRGNYRKSVPGWGQSLAISISIKEERGAIAQPLLLRRTRGRAPVADPQLPIGDPWRLLDPRGQPRGQARGWDLA